MKDVFQRIRNARGRKKSIVEERLETARDVSAAARLFGLNGESNDYRTISRAEALSVLVKVLHKDMAYRSTLMSVDTAKRLAEEFFERCSEEGASHFTNGIWKEEGLFTWQPATDATFDSGILVIARGRVACAWFKDED